jgi:rod shape determining protein RodA
MTQALPMPQRTRYTRVDLHERAKELHKPRVQVWNAGWVCVAAAMVLSILGIIAISTTRQPLALSQIVHLGLGVIGATFIALPHYRWIQRISFPMLIIAIALLIFVLIPWVPEAIVRPRNGARRWISLYFTDFQPSELTKIAYICALASYLRFRRNYRTLFGLFLPLALTFVPMLLILVEPDLGTAMLFLPTLFAMLIAAGAKLWHLVLIITLGLSAAPLAYPVMAPHQQDRIKSMIAQVRGDERYIDDIGYQGARAMTLVGAGGISGVGNDKAADLIRFNHLPEEHNDMIFAVIACRWGLLGALATWTLFILFAIGGLLTAGQCKEPFGRLVAVGIVAVLLAQMTINTGMTIGLLPITGLTLPFVSYGGSSLVSTWLMVGLMLNIALRRPQYLARKSFEFDEPEDEA